MPKVRLTRNLFQLVQVWEGSACVCVCVCVCVCDNSMNSIIYILLSCCVIISFVLDLTAL